MFEGDDEFLSGRFVISPGHTAGSSGFVYDDVLFSGHALQFALEAAD
ncbi:MAG: hypothetical protein QXQ39_04930 [Conexivisphaerales archaeon]